MGTNAKVSTVGSHLFNLASEAGGKPRFVSFSTRLAGEVQGSGAAKMRRGAHLMDYTILTGFSYEAMVQRSADALTAAMANPAFVTNTVAAMAAAGKADEQTGAAVSATDVIDALTGTARGRKGLLTAYSETLAGTNVSTSEHVYDALTVDGDMIPGCKVYTGIGNAADPKAPVPGTVYLAGIVIASAVRERDTNGDKIASKRGAVAVAKDWIERELNLPARKYRTFRILPGEAVSLKSGTVAFHGKEGTAPVLPGAADIATLTR
jgi:hypothetical protein